MIEHRATTPRLGTAAPRSRRAGRVVLAAVFAATLVSCGGDDAGPGFSDQAAVGVATYEYTIPAGAGEALDAGTPLEILPAELNATVGESIEIINLDDRGHNVGPWFVGANETLTQEFTSPGRFEGVCTVHPSGELVLIVES